MHLKNVFVILTAAAVATAFAEYETLNVFGSIGAGFGMGGTHYESLQLETSGTTVADKFFNYGSGFKLNVGCQWFLMENVALQPSFSYSVGIPFKDEDITLTTTTTTTYRRHLFGLKLGVVPRFEVLDLIDMYAGVGLGFFWNSRPFEISEVTEVAGTSVTQDTTGKITSKPSPGFFGLLGADFPLNDAFTLFGEIGFEQISFSLDKYVIKEPVGRTGYYSKDDTSNLDPQKVPGSSFQIHVGVRYAVLR